MNVISWRRHTPKLFYLCWIILIFWFGVYVIPSFYQPNRPDKTQVAPVPSVYITEDRTSVFKERLQYADSECRHNKDGFVKDVWLQNSSQLAYCFVAKIGCTFWKRIFLFLNNDTAKLKPNTPFDIPRLFVHYGARKRTTILHMDRTDPSALNNYTRFLFSRNPYYRLWSVYLDKFFLPDFWRTFAKLIIKHRKYQSEKARMCGNDVSFKEFLTYIASLSPEWMNEHWRPVKYMCDPCKFKPHIIGKLETFSLDARDILRRHGHEWIMDSIQADAQTEDDIKMLIEYNFIILENDKKSFRNCTTRQDVARRLWQAFQLKGYLPMNIPAARVVKELSANFLDKDIFKDYVLKTYHNASPQERKTWKKQQHRAIENAFSEISPKLIKKLVSLYKPDFETFGYDIFPPGRRV